MKTRIYAAPTVKRLTLLIVTTTISFNEFYSKICHVVSLKIDGNTHGIKLYNILFGYGFQMSHFKVI